MAAREARVRRWLLGRAAIVLAVVAGATPARGQGRAFSIDGLPVDAPAWYAAGAEFSLRGYERSVASFSRRAQEAITTTRRGAGGGGSGGSGMSGGSSGGGRAVGPRDVPMGRADGYTDVRAG